MYKNISHLKFLTFLLMVALSCKKETTSLPVISTWQILLKGYVGYICANDNNLIIGGDIGIQCSKDHGNSWNFLPGGLNDYLTALTISGNNLIAGTFDFLYIFNLDNGTKWSIDTSWSNVTGHGCSYLSASGAYVAGGSGFVLSTNFGISWTPINNSAFNNSVRGLAINGSNIFAVTSNGVYLSTNNGTSWNPANNGLAANDYELSIATMGSNIFVGTNNGVFLSTNNGINWTAVNTGLTNTNVISLASDGSNIFAVTQDGFFVSKNKGNNWNSDNTGLPENFYPYSITIDNTYIYIGVETVNGTSIGIYKRSLSTF